MRRGMLGRLGLWLLKPTPEEREIITSLGGGFTRQASRLLRFWRQQFPVEQGEVGLTAAISRTLRTRSCDVEFKLVSGGALEDAILGHNPLLKIMERKQKEG